MVAWSKPIVVHLGAAAMTADITATASAVVHRKTDRPAAENLEELGERLNATATALNAHEEEFGRLKTLFESQVEKARAEASEQHQQIRSVVDREIRRQVAGRKREVILVTLGVVLQFVGAVLIFIQ